MRSMNKLEKLADTLPGVPARIIGWLHNDLTQVYDALPDEAKITEAGEPITGNEFRKP